jgi:Bacterial Ig domain
VVVWTTEGQDGSGRGVFGQLYNNSFGRIGGEFQINQTTLGDQGNASVAGLSNGGFIVSWSGPGDPSGDGSFEQFARTFTAAGAADGNQVVVNQTIAENQFNAANAFLDPWAPFPTGSRALDHTVAQLSNGNVVATWFGKPDVVNNTLFTDAFARVLDVGLNNNPANAIPVADDDSFTVAEGSANNVLDVLNGDVDANPGTTLVVDRIMTQPTNGGGTVTIGANGANVVFTPAANFSGVTTFTYRIFDGSNVNPGRDIATVTVTVLSDNVDPPVITLNSRNPTFFPTNQSVDLFANVGVIIEGPDSIDELKLTVTNVTQGANERLIIDGTPVALNGAVLTTGGPLGVGVSVSLTGTTAIMTITPPAGFDATELAALINGMEYENLSAGPGMARRVVTLTSVSDTNGPVDTRTLALSSWASPSTVTELVTRSTDGVQVTSAPNQPVDTVRSVSANGQFVVFTASDSLAAGDNNNTSDIYLRDRFDGTTTRVSVGSSFRHFLFLAVDLR